MRKKKKIACVIGTRPEVIKMAPVIRRLREHHESFDTLVVATAQHRDMLDQMMDVFALKADIDFDLMRPDQDLAEVTHVALSAMTALLNDMDADVVLAEGDTTTVMATAMACFYARVPFGHVEAGLRTRDLSAPYPEEFNRHVADLVAAYNFAPTSGAAENLRREGLDESAIFITGNTVIDALFHILEHTEPPPVPVPDGARYILMTCHRREIFGEGIREVFSAIREFAAGHPDVCIWYPVHPNPHVSLPAHEMLTGVPNVLLTEPLDYVAFAHAMKGATLLLTDSGGVQEEAPALGKPVVVLRDKTERPEGVAAGTAILVGAHRDCITEALDTLMTDETAYERMAKTRNPFGDGYAAERIVSALSGSGFEPWS